MTGPSLLESLLADRILVLDGAMGTLLWQQGFSGNLDDLTLTHQDVIRGVHHQYLAAGSDIIRTNTFNSTPIAPRDGNLYELNVIAARIARAACDEWSGRTPGRPRLVAGAIGPTRRFVSTAGGPDKRSAERVSVDQLERGYCAQMRALAEGGSDLFLLETVCDPEAALAAIAARNQLDTGGPPPPLMISVTLSGTPGRMPTGHTIEELWERLAPARPFAVGINCSEGPRALGASLEALARMADCFVTCHPSAGLPSGAGEYPYGPQPFAEEIGRYIDRRLMNIVGGCCGTGPEHIRLLGQLPALHTKKPPPPI